MEATAEARPGIHVVGKRRRGRWVITASDESSPGMPKTVRLAKTDERWRALHCIDSPAPVEDIMPTPRRRVYFGPPRPRRRQAVRDVEPQPQRLTDPGWLLVVALLITDVVLIFGVWLFNDYL